MEQVVRIQALRNEENKTYKEIEEDLGVSSKTIAKALMRPEEFTEGYQREGPVPRPALGRYLERIEELLKGKDWAQEKGRKVRRVLSATLLNAAPGARYPPVLRRIANAQPEA